MEPEDGYCAHDRELQGFVPPKAASYGALDRVIFCRDWLDNLDMSAQMNSFHGRQVETKEDLNWLVGNTLSGVAAHEILHTEYSGNCMTSPSYKHIH